MCGNILSAVCGTGGNADNSLWRDLLHFVYYPDCNTASSKLPEAETLPMWGIDAEPDLEILPALKEKGNLIYFGVPQLGAVLNREDAGVKFTNAEGCELLSLIDCIMEPVVVLGEKTYHIRVIFSASEDERYYGLGQHQADEFNYKGKK